MTLDEFKALVLFAKKARVKSVSMDGMSFELFERAPRGKRAKAEVTPQKAVPEPPKLPTLDDINRFIYQDPEEKTQ